MRNGTRIGHAMLEGKNGTLVGILYCHMTKKVMGLEGIHQCKACPCCEIAFPDRSKIFRASSLEKLAEVISKMHDMDGLPVPENLTMEYISNHLEVLVRDKAA